MTPEERLTQSMDELKAEDPEKVFEALRMICDEFGWDLQKRDPGPTIRMLEEWGELAEQPGAFLEAECGKEQIKDSYRHLAVVRRK